MRWKILTLFLFLSVARVCTYAQVVLPRLVRDSMVLQRDTHVNIWGWASINEKVTVQFAGKTYHARAGVDGKWLVQLASLKAGGPFGMTISGRNRIVLKDILVGDVWLCSGQSNMVLPMERVKEKYPNEVAEANNPFIRQFFIPTFTNLQGPQHDLPTGYWKSAVQPDILGFSATAYFFAQKIYERYHIPIGLINSSVGGPPIEAWISEEGLKDFPAYVATAQKQKDTAYVNNVNRLAAPFNRPQKQNDQGLVGPLSWYDTNYIAAGWKRIRIPGYWADQGMKGLNGIVWYRKEIDVPVSATGIDAKLFMGCIVDADFTYINGKLVGNITYQYPPRRYTIPSGLLKPGKNTIVIRVINYAGKGGFVPDKRYCIMAGKDSIDLRGDWQYKVGDAFAPVVHAANEPRSIIAQDQPTALYNAMIAPLTSYTIKGMLWYQGEGNTSGPARAIEYRRLLPALAADWRRQWNEGDIPFLFVQLPNFMDRQYLPSESVWALLRESQLKSLVIPRSAMAVTIDLGEWNDLHPVTKKPVGQRLALAAQHFAYGDSTIVYSGPLFEQQRIEDNRIIIQFTHTGSGLVSIDGEPLSQFAIAGADKKFVWAHARIDGDKVIVWSDEVPYPQFVRYAWADNPDGANLYNKEGLPASPFRTDE